ncbi:hypothetical protein [Streptomonospora salina]|uniref:Uncharacterized protein n=1 Tax=Streptomonospora salina TaxID=104205 RepID=A0A841E7M0_9ACTN|nr:hypothetical protein [Streptomonospora salina]MBB5997299.1 hypothetical protein [Streptomonospora salina]
MTHDQPRSASVVALLADVPTTGHLGAAQAQRFTLDGHDPAERSGPFLDFARGHAARGTKVVALYPRWRGERAQRVVAFARGALREDTVAAVGVDLAPLALSLIADQLAYLCPYLPPGVVAGLADELPRHTLAGGWLRTVANLSTIPISVNQHLGSFAPGVTYLALCSPVPQVVRAPKGEAGTRFPFHPQEPVHVLHSSGGDVDTTAFEGQVLPVLQAAAVRRLPAQPLGPRYWGSAKYAEFVAFSAHPRALTEPARRVRPAACTWCGEPTIVAVCRFCGAANTVPEQPARAAEPAPPPTPAAAPAPARPPAPPERPAAAQPQPPPAADDDPPVPQELPPLPEDSARPAPGPDAPPGPAGPAGAPPPGTPGWKQDVPSVPRSPE